MGDIDRRVRWKAFLVAILLVITLLPPTLVDDPWDDMQPPRTVDDGQTRSPLSSHRSGPPWPTPGVGLPAHYADWTLISSPLTFQEDECYMFPLTTGNGSLEVLAVEDSGRAYRYNQEGPLLRQTQYSPLDVSDWSLNAKVAREGSGRDVLLVENPGQMVRSYWVDDLSYRSTLHTSSYVLGTGDWDGDGYEDVWLRTTSRLLMVLNLTSGHMVATSNAMRTQYRSSTIVADVDGDGRDELVELLSLDSHDLVVYNGTEMERGILHSFPSSFAVKRIKVVPREGQLPLIVGFSYGEGVAWFDLETGISSMMDTDIEDILDVVYPQGPDAAGTPRIYMTGESEVVRRVYPNTTESIDLGSTVFSGKLALVGEQGNSSSVLVLNENTDLSLLATDDLRILASTAPGPYRGRVLAQGDDLRAKGLDGDALVLYAGIHLLDVEVGTVETLVPRVYNTLSAIWSKGPGGRDSLFVLTDSGSESDLMRFHVDNGTLVLDHTTTFDGRAGWMGLFISPSGTEWLLLVTGSKLQAIDPTEPSIAPVAVDTFRVPALGDVDGDGVQELLYYDGDASVRCLNITNRSLEWSLNVTAPVETMLVGEVDDDPDPEVVISYTDGHLEILDGPTRQVEVDTNGTLGNVTSMTVGDVDEDGVPELVLARGPLRDILVVEVRDGDLHEEWHWWSRYDDWPRVAGLVDTVEGPVLPLLEVHPLCVLDFTEGARLGDIRVTKASVDLVDPTEGDQVTLSVEVDLTGGFPTSVLVEVYMDLERDVPSDPIASAFVHMEPGEKVTVDLPWRARLGDHSLHAVANGLHRHLVAERDYGNNELHVNITVKRPYASIAWELGYGEGAGLFGCTAAVDTDGDGKDEILMIDGGGHLVIQDLSGAPPGSDTAGTFAHPTWRSPRLGAVPCLMDVGDADGDGRPDAVIATIDGWVHLVDLEALEVTASIHLNSYGTFDVAFIRNPLLNVTRIAVLDALARLHILSAEDLSVVRVVSSSPGGLRMEVADLDGDTVEDVVVVGRFNNMAVLPAGGLGARVLMDTDLDAVTLTAQGDLDGDGRPELVAFAEGNVSVIEIRSEDNWSNRILWTGAVPEGTSGLAVGDWDWDGMEDLITVGQSLRVYGRTPSTDDLDLSVVAELETGGEINGLTLGHFPDRPGLRVAVPLWDGRLYMVDGLRNETEVLWSGLGLQALSLALGDPDADGIPQVLAGTAMGGVLVVNGITVERDPYPIGGTPWALAVVDWDGDGEDEVAAQTEGGALVILGHDGLVEHTVATGVAGRVEAMAVLPADGDGGPWLAWAEDDWTVHITDMASNVTTSQRYPAPVPVDLSTVTMTNGTRLLIMPRAGGFSTLDPADPDLTVYFPVHAETTAVAGYPDFPMVVAADGTGRVYLINIETGDPGAETTLEEAATLLLARDLDGDTMTEVVAVTDGGAVHILRGDTLVPKMAPMYPMGSPVTELAAADLDLDGAVELVLGGWSEMVAVRVGQGKPLPDLAIVMEGLPEGPLDPGEEVLLLVEVRNRGLAPTGSFQTVVTLDDQEVQAVGTSLEPLGWTRLGVTVNITDWDQTSTLTVRTDVNDTVVEFDEGNNVFEVILRTIQETEYVPDMWVEDLDVTPSMIPQGTSATLTAMVANRGNASFAGVAVVFALDAANGHRQLGTHYISVLPGTSVEIGQTLEGLVPSDVAVLIEVRTEDGKVMASMEVTVEVIPLADLGLTGLGVNLTRTPRVYAGEPVHMDTMVTNTGGARGSGLLVLEAEVNGTLVVLTTARLDLAAGDLTRVSLSFVPAVVGNLVLEARIIPDGEDITTEDDRLSRTIMVLPHPRTYARLDQMLVEMTETGLHLTVVMSTGHIPGAGALEVRAYALEPGYALSIADDPVAGLEAGMADVYNDTREGLEVDAPVLFDTFISPFQAGPNGTVVLVVAYYLEGGERVPVGHAMELVTGPEDGGGGGEGDDGNVKTWIVLTFVLIAVAVVCGLYLWRTRVAGSGRD